MSKELIGHEGNLGWKPLAESTVQEKEALGYTHKVSPTDPLLRTGELRDSIQAVVHPGFTETVGEVGTDVPYASDQENGTPRIPARPFISPPFITMEPRSVAALGKLASELLNPEKR